MKWFSIVMAAIVLCFSPYLPVCASESEWQTVIGLDGVGGMDMSKPSEKFNIEDRAKGVGLVVIACPGHSPIPVGTAWLYKTDVLATNAHVAAGLVDALKILAEKKISGVPYYLPNKTRGKFVRIIDWVIHPGYGKTPVDMNGKSPVNQPDVALMRIEEKLPSPLSVASKNTLRGLKPGDAIQYIGFPIEKLHGDNINFNNVIATTKTGTIAAMSDWWLGDSGPEANKVIRHDMGSAGGASGSPIFNKNGEVIGLHNAGNYVHNIVVAENGKLTVHRRVRDAAMINFGVRADLLDDVSFK